MVQVPFDVAADVFHGSFVCSPSGSASSRACLSTFLLNVGSCVVLLPPKAEAHYSALRW